MASQREINKEFRVYDNALPSPLFKRLLEAGHVENKDETSYWYPVNEKTNTLAPARCCVEQIMQYIHENLLPIHIPLKGVEWWLHRRDPTTYMHMHFDCDEGYYASTLQARYPRLSSVFYVNNVGGPTLVVNQVVQGGRLYPEVVQSGFSVTPTPNRLMFFPGRMLHGTRTCTHLVAEHTHTTTIQTTTARCDYPKTLNFHPLAK